MSNKRMTNQEDGSQLDESPQSARSAEAGERCGAEAMRVLPLMRTLSVLVLRGRRRTCGGIALRVLEGDAEAAFDVSVCGDGSGLERAVHPDDVATLEAIFAAPPEDAPPLCAEVRLVDRAGATRWMRCAFHPVARRCRAQCWEGLALDVSEAKATGAALSHAELAASVAERSKAEFLANVGHELRTPLNAIMGFSEAMRRGLHGPLGHPRYRQYVEDIASSAGRLHAVIEEVLAMSRIETGRETLRETRQSPASLVERAAALYADRASEAGVAVVLDASRDLPRLLVDGAKVRQMLGCLLSNAIRFSPPGREVVLAAREEAEGVSISVSDTGIGMSESEKVRVLRPFAQADGSLARRRDGLGLGLPLAVALAELHGAHLSVESAPGEGTRVTILFPAARVLDGADKAPVAS